MYAGQIDFPQIQCMRVECFILCPKYEMFETAKYVQMGRPRMLYVSAENSNCCNE